MNNWFWKFALIKNLLLPNIKLSENSPGRKGYQPLPNSDTVESIKEW
jgi:hypothetical protein